MKDSIFTQFRIGPARWALAAAALLAVSGVSAKTMLKFAHVYEVSEPYHSAALWAAGEIPLSAPATATRWRFFRPRRSARKPTSTRA